eukprot:gene3512-4012_t
MTKAVATVQWYPFDTGMFFSGSIDGRVDVWDTNGEVVSRTFDLEASVNAIAFSSIPSSHLLIAVATADQKARLCDIRTGMSTHCLAGHLESILTLAWAPFSPYHLATGSQDKTIRLWDIRRADTYMMALDQHNETTTNISTSPTRVGSGGGGGNDSGMALKLHKNSYFAKHGKPYSTSSINPGDVKQGSLNMSAKRAPPAHNGFVTCLVWTPDGQALLSTGSDMKIRRWDMQRGTNTFVDFPQAYNTNKLSNQMCLSHDGNYLFHPNGKTIHVYNADTGDLVRHLKGHFERVNCCVFHPKDEIVFSGANDKQLLVWDTTYQYKSDLLEEEQSMPKSPSKDEDTIEFNNALVNNNNNNEQPVAVTLPDEDNCKILLKNKRDVNRSGGNQTQPHSGNLGVVVKMSVKRRQSHSSSAGGGVFCLQHTHLNLIGAQQNNPTQ